MQMRLRGAQKQAKISKTTIIVKIKKILEIFQSLDEKWRENVNKGNGDPRRSSENYENYDNCENNKNLEVFQSRWRKVTRNENEVQEGL